MSTLLLRAMMACGLSGAILAGGWFTAVGLTLGAIKQTVTAPGEFVADPKIPVFHAHDAHCLYMNTDRPMTLPNIEAAKKFGKPCPACLSGLQPSQQSASSRPRP